MSSKSLLLYNPDTTLLINVQFMSASPHYFLPSQPVHCSCRCSSRLQLLRVGFTSNEPLRHSQASAYCACSVLSGWSQPWQMLHSGAAREVSNWHVQVFVCFFGYYRYASFWAYVSIYSAGPVVYRAVVWGSRKEIIKNIRMKTICNKKTSLFTWKCQNIVL